MFGCFFFRFNLAQRLGPRTDDRLGLQGLWEAEDRHGSSVVKLAGYRRRVPSQSFIMCSNSPTVGTKESVPLCSVSHDDQGRGVYGPDQGNTGDKAAPEYRHATTPHTKAVRLIPGCWEVCPGRTCHLGCNRRRVSWRHAIASYAAFWSVRASRCTEAAIKGMGTIEKHAETLQLPEHVGFTAGLLAASLFVPGRISPW